MDNYTVIQGEHAMAHELKRVFPFLKDSIKYKEECMTETMCGPQNLKYHYLALYQKRFGNPCNSLIKVHALILREDPLQCSEVKAMIYAN